MAFDTQKPGDASPPLVAAVHTLVTVWVLAAMLLPKPCLPLIQACARAFPPASQRLAERASAFIWNTSVALVEVNKHRVLHAPLCALVWATAALLSLTCLRGLLSAVTLQYSLLQGLMRPGSQRMGGTLLLLLCLWAPSVHCNAQPPVQPDCPGVQC